MNPLKGLVHLVGRAYCTLVCRRAFGAQTFRRVNERPIEYAFIFTALARLNPERILDVGTGTSPLPEMMRLCGPVVTATDNIEDYWPRGMFNRHYHVLHDDIRDTKLTQQFDLVTCVSVLEHIPEAPAAMRSMRRLLGEGGHLALTIPYNERQFIPNAYDLPDASYGQGNPYVCQVFSREELDLWTGENGLRIAEQEYWQVFTGDFWTCGQRVIPPRRVDREDRHHLTCLLLEACPCPAP